MLVLKIEFEYNFKIKKFIKKLGERKRIYFFINSILNKEGISGNIEYNIISFSISIKEFYILF